VKHALEETGQRLSALPNHVLNLCHQLFLAFFLECHDFNWAALSLSSNVCVVISVFKGRFEFVQVAAALEKCVLLISDEALAERTTNGLRIGIIEPEGHHF